jgi:DNA-binding MarR family transcriptional regulator
MNDPRASASRNQDDMLALLDVARGLHARLDTALNAVGLSVTKFEALDALARKDEPVALRDMALHLECARSNITQLMDRLEVDGLVERLDDPGDRRAVRARLTKLGREKHNAGRLAMQVVQAEVAACCEPKDRELFTRVLDALK